MGHIMILNAVFGLGNRLEGVDYNLWAYAYNVACDYEGYGTVNAEPDDLFARICIVAVDMESWDAIKSSLYRDDVNYRKSIALGILDAITRR